MSSQVVAGVPVQVGGDPVHRAHDPGRVARPPVAQVGLDVVAGLAQDRAHHLEHRRALAAADVVRGRRRLAGLQVLGHRHVGVGQVDHVHVVAHARAVGRVVVGAEHQRRLPARQRAEDLGEQVVRAVVGQLHRAGADHVEVAQRRVVQIRVAHRDVAQQPLADDLALAVGALGRRRGVLVHDLGVGRAVPGRAAGEQEVGDAALGHRLQQHLGAGHVGTEELQRLLDRDAGVLQAGQVHDARDLAACPARAPPRRRPRPSRPRSPRRPARSRGSRWTGRQAPPRRCPPRGTPGRCGSRCIRLRR